MPSTSYMKGKWQGVGYSSQVSWGPCHYYTLRSGRRVIFRANEIAHVRSETLYGVFTVGVVEATSGCLYDTTSAIPDRITGKEYRELAKLLDETETVAEKLAKQAALDARLRE